MILKVSETMLPIVYFVFLISCSALAKSENKALSLWWDPEISSRSESLNRLMDTRGNDLLVQPNIIFCCVCQEAVKRAKAAIHQKITQNINFVCNKFIVAFRKICLQRAVKYRDIVLHTLFPGGNAKATCMKIKLC